MFKITVNRVLTMVTTAIVLLALIVPNVLMDKSSETAVFATVEDYDSEYPSDSLSEEYPTLVTEIPIEPEIPTEPERDEVVEEYEEEPIEIMPFNLPVMTYAELVSAILAATDGDTIVLGADINAEAHTVIPINANMTLTSTAGNNFVFTVTTQRHFIVNTNGVLQLENITLSGDSPNITAVHGGVQVNAGGRLYLNTGSVIENNRAATGGGVQVQNGGTLIIGTPIIEGGVISNNFATGNGGGVFVAASGTFQMRSGAIRGNEGTNGGGVNIEPGVFTMYGGVIEGNTARGQGGGMRISGANVNLNGGAIQNNTAVTTGGGVHLATNVLNRLWIHTGAIISGNNSGTHGGGINTSGGRTYLLGGTISGNWTSGNGNGGGVNLLPAGGSVPVFIMEDGIISGNWTSGTGNGGGVNLSLAGTIFPQFTMNDGTISINDAQQGGGVSISTGASSIFTMNDGTISGNTARTQGGGVNINQGSFEMFDGIIRDNTAATQGGGIRMENNGIVDIHAGEIRNNTAGNVGGGIHIGQVNTERGLLHIHEDVLITKNTATTHTGGGVNFTGGSLILNGTITNNVSGHDGGGIEIGSNIPSILDVEIDGALFSGNTSGGAGGAINTQNVNVNNNRIFTIQNTELYNNHADNRGGGMRLGNTGNLTLGQGNNIIVHGNSTYGNGGGIFVASSFGVNATLDIYDGVHIFDNIANHGGGVYHHGGTVQMHGAEIRDNIAHINGGGVTLNNASVSAGNFTIHSGIIDNNTANNNGGGVHARSSHSTFNMLAGSIQNNTAGNNGGGINIGSSAVSINGEIHHNTANNHGGGMWLALHDNPVSVYGGEFTDNHAGGDGGAIFVTHTRVDNPLIDAINVYPRLHTIANSTIFTNNSAGGGEFAPPDNYYEITRFNGQLMTNYDINYRSNWRVIYLLNGGNIGGNEEPIEYIFQTDWTVEERTIGDARVPGPPVRDGYIFLGWRNRDSEPEWDEHWDGILPDNYIWSAERVAAHVVTSSTVFEAIWEPRPHTVTYTVEGPAPATYTPALDTLGGTYQTGATVTVADELIPTTNLYIDGTTIGTWIFVGWRRAEENLESGETFIMPNEDVILIGTWLFEPLPLATFEFHKTGEALYNASEWDTPGWIEAALRSGAHFSLFRYTGDGTPTAGIVTDAMIAADTWEYVDSGISSGVIGTPIEFQLIPGRYYHLVETLPPAGYQLPLGQWRIVAVTRDDGEEIGFRITYQGDSPPAFANIGGDFEDSAHFGGTFFVGNRLEFELPIFGGTGTSIMIKFAGVLILMTTLIVAVRYMIRQKFE